MWKSEILAVLGRMRDACGRRGETEECLSRVSFAMEHSETIYFGAVDRFMSALAGTPASMLGFNPSGLPLSLVEYEAAGEDTLYSRYAALVVEDLEHSPLSQRYFLMNCVRETGEWVFSPYFVFVSSTDWNTPKYGVRRVLPSTSPCASMSEDDLEDDAFQGAVNASLLLRMLGCERLVTELVVDRRGQAFRIPVTARDHHIKYRWVASEWDGDFPGRVSTDHCAGCFQIFGEAVSYLREHGVGRVA